MAWGCVGWDRVWSEVRRSGSVSVFKSAFFPSLSLTVLSLFPKIVSNLEKLLFQSFFNDSFLLALVFLLDVVANLAKPGYIQTSRINPENKINVVDKLFTAANIGYIIQPNLNEVLHKREQRNTQHNKNIA